MKQLTTIISLVGVCLALAGAAAGGDEFAFEATLSGAQEVVGPPFLAPQPGVETATTGQLTLTFDPALASATFRFQVNQGEDITQAHLHCAPAGVNGPVTVFLFPAGPPPSPGMDINGLLAEGALTNASVVAEVDCIATCDQPVNNIASLRAAILEGCIYVNVHSVAQPDGVIRGQVHPVVEPPSTQ